MSFVSEIDNDDVDEPGMDMPGFEGTWAELGKIEAIAEMEEEFEVLLEEI
tara:strand:- start:224 stop:373 length:150 start_codon:yes stop_codon:yes gene_type:complete